METKIALINESKMVGKGYYYEYLKNYVTGKKISARIDLLDAKKIFVKYMLELIDPILFLDKVNQLQIELNDFYTEVESRMIINLFKKHVSIRAGREFNTEDIAFGLDYVIINDSEIWEYVIFQTITQSIFSVEYIDYFKYKDSFCYVVTFRIAVLDENDVEIDEFNEFDLLTDQIKDYWDLELHQKIHLEKSQKSCLAHLILTFDKGQEMCLQYVPFKMLGKKELFVAQLLKKQVKSNKRKRNLKKISTFIFQTPDQKEKMGSIYNEFISWYLPCNGKFYFNETDK